MKVIALAFISTAAATAPACFVATPSARLHVTPSTRASRAGSTSGLRMKLWDFGLNREVLIVTDFVLCVLGRGCRSSTTDRPVGDLEHGLEDGYGCRYGGMFWAHRVAPQAADPGWADSRMLHLYLRGRSKTSYISSSCEHCADLAETNPWFQVTVAADTTLLWATSSDACNRPGTTFPPPSHPPCHVPGLHERPRQEGRCP